MSSLVDVRHMLLELKATFVSAPGDANDLLW